MYELTPPKAPVLEPLIMFDRDKPFNSLPALPPAGDIETAAVLKKAISASRAMAELKGMAERMPNQAMLIDHQ